MNTNQAGKGDKVRPYNPKSFGENYDKIFSKKKTDYNLLLDDNRFPKECWLDEEKVSLIEHSGIVEDDWRIVRSFEAFKGHIESFGVPDVVSFDFDLCTEHTKHFIQNYHKRLGEYEWKCLEGTGAHCCIWLKEYCANKGIPFPAYHIHSANFHGRFVLRELLK